MNLLRRISYLYDFFFILILEESNQIKYLNFAVKDCNYYDVFYFPTPTPPALSPPPTPLTPAPS